MKTRGANFLPGANCVDRGGEVRVDCPLELVCYWSSLLPEDGELDSGDTLVIYGPHRNI